MRYLASRCTLPFIRLLPGSLPNSGWISTVNAYSAPTLTLMRLITRTLSSIWSPSRTVSSARASLRWSQAMKCRLSPTRRGSSCWMKSPTVTRSGCWRPARPSARIFPFCNTAKIWSALKISCWFTPRATPQTWAICRRCRRWNSDMAES